VVTAQYPGGDVQRAAETGAGAARPARVIFDDARAAISRPQDPRQQMPASAGERPAAARAALDRAPRAPMGVTGAATRTTTPGTPALPAQQQHRNVAITR
jgi:hypothetical protein